MTHFPLDKYYQNLLIHLVDSNLSNARTVLYPPIELPN